MDCWRYSAGEWIQCLEAKDRESEHGRDIRCFEPHHSGGCEQEWRLVNWPLWLPMWQWWSESATVRSCPAARNESGVAYRCCRLCRGIFLLQEFREHAQWDQRLIAVDVDGHHLLLAVGCRRCLNGWLLDHRLIEKDIDVRLRTDGLVENSRRVVRGQ